MKRILLTIFFGLWAISANATVQVKALTGQPVQVCQPSDPNSNCGGGGGGSGLTVGTTTIANGTNGYVEYNNNGVLGEEAVSGTGTVTSVTFTGDGIVDSSTPSSAVTTSGTVTATAISQAKNLVLAGPSSGSNASPSFRALSGADLPNPSATTLGGIESLASVSHNFLTSISTSGVPAQAQPAYSDISGSIPAITALTGDVTASGTGSVAASVVKVNGLAIPASKTIVGTNSSGQFVDASSATLSNNTSGNAATATALSANGSNCSSGHYPLGVDASGNSESCTTAPTECSTSSCTLNTSTTAVTQATGDNTTSVATDAFVQSQISAQVEMHDAVQAATTTALILSPTYSNGSSGVGATLTAGTVGVLVLDGYTPNLGDRILVKNQASSLQNGCYTVTTLGVVITTDYVLTRCTDFNQVANIDYGDTFPVLQGSTNTNQQFTMNNAGFTTVGAAGSTGQITFAQTSGGSQLVQGTGITITGNTIALTTPVTAANGGSGVSNTATMTLGSSNVNLATLGTGIVKNTTTTGNLTNAVAADVVGLFSTCSGTQYLGADGSCHTASGSGTVTSSGSPVSGNIAKFSTSTNIVPAAAADIVALFSTCSGTQYLGADGSCHSGGGGSPGGSNTQVQYNNSSSFGGITNATTDGTTMQLTSFEAITSILDTNANTLLGITATASAVNYLTLANAATTTNPTMTSAGSDSNIGFTYTPKGTGAYIVNSASTLVPNFVVPIISLLASPVTGGVEADTNELYYTHANSERGVIPAEQWMMLTSTRTMPSSSAANIFNVGSNSTGEVAVSSSTTYEFDMILYISGMSSTTGTASLTFATSGTIGSIFYFVSGSHSTAANAVSATDFSGNVQQASATAVTTSTTTTTCVIYAHGIIRVTTGGTITPEISFSQTSTPVIGVNSFFSISPKGTNTTTSIGNIT